MGSVMRRSSFVLSISRPSSAAPERDTDISSLRDAAAEAQESAGPSPDSLAKPVTSSEIIPPTLPPTGYIPPPVIDAFAGNPGAYTDDELHQPDVELVDHADNTTEFSEAVYGNANDIFPYPFTNHDPFADPIAPRITQPVFDMPQYVNLGLSTTSPTLAI